MDDETLLRRYAREGDEAAFRALAGRYGGLVYAACLRDLLRSELAEDAAQAVFLVLARKAGRLRVRTTLVPWLVATARLVSRGVLRAERRRPTVPLDERLPAPEASSDAALFEALDALSGSEREAVVLRFVQGLSLAEVGRAQGVSEDAARMRVNRALKRLRTEYVPALAAPLSLNARLATLALPKPLVPMTMPLLLAMGGALVATGAAATLLHRPALPLATPTVATAKRAVPSQAKPFDESKFKLAKPGPPPPKIATLEGPFTLVYRLTITDLRTKRMRDAAIADRTKDLAKEVDADRMTQARMDAELARMKAPPQPRTETITLAYDGKTLFYEDRPDGGDDPRPIVNLFDGKHTTFFWTKISGGKQGSQGSREDGTVQYWTWNMPYIGPSVPFFPVTRGREILMLSAYDKKPVYRPFGSVEAGPKGATGKLLLGGFDPQDTVVLSGWASLHGTVVAGSIVWTKRAFEMYHASEDMLKPEWRYAYTLVTARPAAESTLFGPDAYLEDGMDFQVGGGSNVFKIDRTKGTLEQQIAAHGGSR